ncbi:WAT1-related protein At5g64700-like [Carica papaya]|uniref:WAT1-related protein At5g64700-like n=1 Tax=Carica papaya TaxID=3649 RepID=UPI000B8CF1E3|nr:WAT1-related protein At5g64700-like [Carica papaya]
MNKYFRGGDSQVAASMVMVQVLATGLQLLSKLVLSQGTFIFALMAYRHVVAALCVAPLAFFLERGGSKKLSRSGWLWLFVSALTGVTMAMGMFYYGLRDTTTSYALNFINLIPVITFVLSIIARMEKLRVGTRAGKIKILGATLCVAGALTTSLYKGKGFHIGHHSLRHPTAVKTSKVYWFRGTFILNGSCLSYDGWFLVQVKSLQVFPSKYWAIMLTCILASLQATIIGLCVDRRKASWRLGWDLQLVTIIYSGALATAATYCLITWAIAKKGPTYPPMFNPLALVFVTVAADIILGEEVSAGSLVGMFLIMVGLYSFLWGAKQDQFTSLPQPDAETEDAVAPATASEFVGIQPKARVLQAS